MDRRILVVALPLLLVVGFSSDACPQEPSEADEQLVKAAGVKSDTGSLLQFFQQRTLRDEDRTVLDGLVRTLDSDSYEERQKAHDDLLLRGPLALPFLKAVIGGSSPLEMRRRAEDMVRKIETSVARDATAAAGRLLAARQAEGAVEVLLRYLPNIDDAWLEEEVLTSLGRLSIRQGRADAKLLAALKDPLPLRRGAVLYLLGRRADVAQRALVRSFLADADLLVRTRAAEGLVGKRVLQTVLDSGTADEATLKAHNVAITEETLLDFLRKRTPDAAEQARLATLVAALGAFEYSERFVAAEVLVKAGIPALAFLKPALNDADAEVARRARRCIEEIQRGPGPALPTAVVRRLAWPGLAKDVPAAVRTLLAFVPFAEDELLEEETLTALMVLSLRHEMVDPSLAAALGDPMPSRRAAAAYVLGCVGAAEQVSGVRKLLADDSTAVQLRAAQGLLAARDHAAVPKLIALLGEVRGAGIWRIEEALNRLAGDQVPAAAAVADLTPDGRRKAVAAWQKWWQDRQGSIDLARAAEGDSYLGLLTVCEYDNVVPGKFNGQVWEGPRNGPARLKVGDLVGPMDAQVLANGRILIAENGANRVTERDRDGVVKWDCTIQGGNPICCQRLPNGNTFIAMYNQLLEVRPDKSEVYRYSPGPQFYIFGARKTRTGSVVCVTAQNALLEIDPVQGKTLRTISLGQPGGGWAGVEPLPNGNFLVATMNNNTVREVDHKGNSVWSFSTIQGAFRATSLPNGNILVISMNTREVVELDRSGAVRWKHTCQGRPWSVHYR